MNYISPDDLIDIDLEMITLEITKPKSKPFLINCWYRPPDATQECLDIYEELIIKIDSENKEVILIGDFNCDWSLLSNNKANASTKKLAEIMNTYQFNQLIEEPTRITTTTRTLIDLAFTYRVSQKKRNPHKLIMYLLHEITIHNNLVIIHNCLFNKLDISVPLGFHIFCTV